MSGGISATAVAGLTLSAAGTAASVAGQASSQSAAAGQAAQQQAWGIFTQQQQAAAMSMQAAWERTLGQQREVVATRAIEDSQQRGQVAEQISRLTTAQIAGRQRAGLAAQGTDIAGSPTEILADTAAAGEFDARTIRSNAAREAYGHQLELVNAENDVSLAQAKQDNAKPGLVSIDYKPSYVGAAGSLLSGASNLAEKWWRFQQSAPGPTPYANVTDLINAKGLG